MQTAAEVSPTESLKQHVRFDLNDDEHIQKPLTPSPSTRPRSPPPPPPSSPHLQRPAVKRFPVIPPAPATFLHHQNHKIDLPIRVYCKMLTVDQLRQNAALPPVNLVWVNRPVVAAGETVLDFCSGTLRQQALEVVTAKKRTRSCCGGGGGRGSRRDSETN